MRYFSLRKLCVNLGGGPVSAASKDFFMASMAASCKLFARHCSHHNHYFLAVYDSHQHPHLVNLFYCLGPRFFSSRHPVVRAKLQHILFNSSIWKLQTLSLCITCSVDTLKYLNYEHASEEMTITCMRKRILAVETFSPISFLINSK